jgi:hypothetical protein
MHKFPGVKRGRGVTLTTHPHLVPRLSMSRSYTSSPPMRLHGMQRNTFTFLLTENMDDIYIFVSDYVTYI